MSKPLTPEELRRDILEIVKRREREAERRGHAAGLREGAEIARQRGRRVAAAISAMRARAEEVERGE